MGSIPIKGLKNEFETAVVNEPSMFEPLKVYCILEIYFDISSVSIRLSSGNERAELTDSGRLFHA